MILHAQLEIWKAANAEANAKNWMPETVPAPAVDISEGKFPIFFLPVKIA